MHSFFNLIFFRLLLSFLPSLLVRLEEVIRYTLIKLTNPPIRLILKVCSRAILIIFVLPAHPDASLHTSQVGTTEIVPYFIRNKHNETGVV